MGPKNLVPSKRRPQEDEIRTLDHAGKEQSDEGTDSDSDSGAAEEGATLLVPPKKPKFTTPYKQPGPEPAENGSACSSPSASGFIIVPSQKPRREKEMQKKSPASKVFSDDDVISLLKGLAVFWVNGKNNKWAEFHHFVKDDLPNQFTKTQISEKIRNLKKKFHANSERARANGGRIDLSDHHESVVFELSKALWGDENGIAQEKGQMGENGDEEVNEMQREREQVVENDEGSKNRKKRKQVGEHGEENKKMRKREHGIEELLEEGDERDAANTILSIRKLVDKHGEENKKMRKQEHIEELLEEGNKKTRKKKRKQGDERDEKKEIVMEGIQVDCHDDGNKISIKRKQVDGSGERNKKTRKTKLVDECGEATKTAKEQKEVDEHAKSREFLKEVNQVDQDEEEEEEEEEEELLKEGKQVDEHEQQDKTSKKQKQVDEHDVKKDLAKQGKQVDDHREENKIPANQKHETEIRVGDFQSAYPLLYASFHIFGCPKVSMEKCVLIGRENAQELEEKWRELNAEVHRLELKKIDLMNRQGK